MQISLCLIVKNEEKTLGKCLRSFSPLAKEIIVVDTGSTDKTKQIAEAFGTKVLDFEWIDDFSAARNFAVSQASQEWLMMVDADDSMEAGTLNLLLEELKNLEKETEVISLPYIYQKSEGNSKNIAYLPRIWRRSLRLEWKYPIHEYLDFSKIPKVKTKKIDLSIIHKKEEKNFKNSFQRNVILLKKYLLKNPTDLRVLYYMVHDSYQLNDWEGVIEWSEKYLEATPEDSVKTCRTLVRKGWAHLNRKEWREAHEAFLLANGINALLIEPYLALGDLYKKEGRYEEAVQMYECARLCKMPKTQSNVFYNASMYHYYALKKLAYTLPFLNKKEKAIDYAEKTLKYCPKNEALRTYIQKLKSELNSS